jgi:ligand-binding sensor domain-containing protein
MEIDYVFNFLETKDKKLLALTDKGIYQFSESIWNKVVLYKGYENHPCRDIVESDGDLYVNYATAIYCRNKGGKWMHIGSDKNVGSIFNVMTVHNDQILVSTLSNLYKIENHRLVALFKKDIGNKSFFCILIDSKNRLWISGDNFLKISAPSDWNHFPVSVDLKGFTFSMTEDKTGNFWLGTTGGLIKIKNISYETIDKNHSMPLDGIYNIIPLPDNRMIFSSGTKGGLLLFKNNCCKTIPSPSSSDDKNYFKDPVDAYTTDKRNLTWMVTRYRRLLCFDGSKLSDFSSSLQLKTTENIYDLEYVKKRGRFFICADSTLLYGDPFGFSLFIPSNTKTAIVKPTRIRALKNGLLLLYVDGKGVFALNDANNLISLIRQTGIDGSKKGIQLPVCFYEDQINNFWISVPGLGLYQYGFKKDEFPFLENHFSLKDGLQSNKILAVTSDHYNRIWVATSTGLDILQMNAAGKYEIFNFAKEEELGLNETFSEKIVTDAAGNIWLSSPNKILRFNPASLQLKKEAPNVIIEKISLAFKETDWSKLADSLYSYYRLPYHPVLKYNQNSLGISFNAVDLSTSNSSPEYSYKLSPLDKSWSTPSATKLVSFAQLPSGKYEFAVKAKDRASGWGPVTVFSFDISAPFWERWWFRLLIIAIAAIIIIGIFQAKIQKIKRDSIIRNQLKELEMKALKAQMNPHFIYNALNSIQSLFANDKKPEGIHYIGSFSRLLRQVLDNSENNVVSLSKELETIGLYIQLETLRMDMQLQYQTMIPEDIVTEFEKIPPLILQPFVENSLWHGLNHKEGQKEILISFSIENDWLICNIRDNGIGRQKAIEIKSLSLSLHASKAIDITRKRLIDFNDTDLIAPVEFVDLYDTNNSPCGTEVMVRIKRKAGYV